MKIFATNIDSKKSAESLEKKIIKNSIQNSISLLDSAVVFYGGPSALNKTYLHSIDYLWNQWTRKTRNNYRWMCDYFFFLCKRYKKIYKKKYIHANLFEWFKERYVHFIPIGPLTEFYNITNYQNLPTTEAYEKELNEIKIKYILIKKNKTLCSNEKKIIDLYYKNIHL